LKDGIQYIFSSDLMLWGMLIFGLVFLLIVAPSNLSPLMLVRTFGSEIRMLTVLQVSFDIDSISKCSLFASVGSYLFLNQDAWLSLRSQTVFAGNLTLGHFLIDWLLAAPTGADSLTSRFLVHSRA
jgi:hypothetical protein